MTCRIPKNMEKSKARPGEYVGYYAGCQRIRPAGGIGWESYGLCSLVGTPIYRRARTLKELDALLTERATTIAEQRAIAYGVLKPKP